MKEVEVVELFPNGLTKVDLRNDERKHYMFPKGFLDDLARSVGCNCERCQNKSADQPTGDV